MRDLPQPTISDFFRFFEKVEIAESGCWNWIGQTVSVHYGIFTSGRKHRRLATHFVYAWFFGPTPHELEIDHLCVNPSCVNPNHLEAVTHAENMKRMAAHITHCKHGHEFTPENTYRWSHTGRRQCKTCHNERQRRAYIPIAQRLALEGGNA